MVACESAGEYLLISCFSFLACQQNFSLQQFGLNSGRASIASATSLPPTQVFTTIGIFKGERVAIKKVAKKKVSLFLLHILLDINVSFSFFTFVSWFVFFFIFFLFFFVFLFIFILVFVCMFC